MGKQTDYERATEIVAALRANGVPEAALGPIESWVERETAECDHPGIGHEFWSYTGVCPSCRKCKFIGHGPLCGDCYDLKYEDAGERTPSRKPTRSQRIGARFARPTGRTADE